MNKRYKKIERVEFTGLMEESKEAFNYCEQGSFRIIRSGPLRHKDGGIDKGRFKIIAEREVST